jgi:hypothetical protein
MKTIALEIMREGKSYNQLLSPLPRYLAVCGAHEPEVAHVPYEHAEFLRRLSRLSGDRELDVELRAEMESVAGQLRDMLKNVRSLSQGLEAGGAGAAPIALEMVLSASELALLPFELVAPPGGPARELGACSEVVLFRRSRRVPNSTLRWPNRPRILFAFATAPGYPDVPARAHLLALRQVLDPWIAHTSRETGAAAFGALIDLCADASLHTLARACASGDYDFVHILAHGKARDGKLGIALRGMAGGEDVVDGQAIATALLGDPPHDRPPSVVTIAACQSGDVGDVLLPGGSVAHAIHEAGVPMVVASQFPLTFRGSIVLTRELYRHMLWGEDPRTALLSTRRALLTQAGLGGSALDWASLVAYLALPENIEHQSANTRLAQARRAIDSAIAWVDVNVIPRPEVTASRLEQAAVFQKDALERAGRVIDEAELVKWFPGSAHKRWAEAVATIFGVHDPRVTRGLTLAVEAYRRTYAFEPSIYALVQEMVCASWRAGKCLDPDRAGALLTLLSSMDAQANPPRARTEKPHEITRTVLELEILVRATDRAKSQPRDRQRILDLIRRLAELARDDAFELYSLVRQLKRHALFFPQEVVQTWVRDALDDLEDVGARSTWTAIVEWDDDGQVIVPDEVLSPPPKSRAPRTEPAKKEPKPRRAARAGAKR